MRMLALPGAAADRLQTHPVDGLHGDAEQNMQGWHVINAPKSCCRALTYTRCYAGYFCEGRWVISWIGDAA